MIRAVATLAALGALIVAAPAAARNPAEPVAFLPFFKADYDTNGGFPWLDEAVVITMASDLQERRRIKIVDRRTTYEAVADVLYPKNHPDRLGYRRPNSVEVAVEVAKKAGAKTVLYGAYREPGGQIQLEAKLVDVGSGKVLREATAARLSTELFHTQDALLNELFPGYRPPERRRAHDDLDKKNLIHAYGLYALGATSRDPANAIRLLHTCLEADPAFFYASDRMAELEAMGRHRAKLASLSGTKLEKSLRSEFEANRVPSQNPNEQGYFFFDLLAETGYPAAIPKLADRMYRMKWEEHDNFIRSNALYWKRRSLLALKKNEEAFEVGEQYKKEFAAERFYSVITRDNAKLAASKAARAETLAKLDAELAKIDNQIARVGRERCQTVYRNNLYLRAVSECRRFADDHRQHADPAVRTLAHESQWDVAQALSQLGRFSEARKVARALVTEAPEFAQQRNLETRMKSWPQD